MGFIVVTAFSIKKAIASSAKTLNLDDGDEVGKLSRGLYQDNLIEIHKWEKIRDYVRRG